MLATKYSLKEIAPIGSIIFFILFLSGCVTIPMKEMSASDMAIRGAKKARAETLVPSLFRKAENYYLMSKRDFEKGYYDAAKKHADEARISAEKAEYAALKKSRLELLMKESQADYNEDTDLGSSHKETSEDLLDAPPNLNGNKEGNAIVPPPNSTNNQPPF